jgi:TonB family protein
MIPEMSYTVSMEPEAKPLVSPRTGKRIFKGVLLAHVIFILIPFLWICVGDWFTPKPPDVLAVNLIAMPKSFSAVTNIPAGNPPSGDPGPPGPPGPPEPTPPSPAKIEVSEPAPREPAITPLKPPPPEPRVIDLQKKVKQKIQQKKQQEAAAKKAAEESKKFKPASSTELAQMINAKRVGPTGSGGYGKGQGTGQAPPGPIGYGGRGAGEFTAPYEQALGFYLKQYWDTPEKRLLGSKMPEVTVQINISADGRLISYRILKLSGNQLMDDSVERLFMSVRQVPPPPDHVPREVTLIMAIGEDDK